MSDISLSSFDFSSNLKIIFIDVSYDFSMWSKGMNKSIVVLNYLKLSITVSCYFSCGIYEIKKLK